MSRSDVGSGSPRVEEIHQLRRCPSPEDEKMPKRGEPGRAFGPPRFGGLTPGPRGSALLKCTTARPLLTGLPFHDPVLARRGTVPGGAGLERRCNCECY